MEIDCKGKEFVMNRQAEANVNAKVKRKMITKGKKSLKCFALIIALSLYILYLNY
jgi:hypothetical protein